MPEKEWRLGVDIDTHDSLLDGITFDDLILTVHCNCREINEQTVRLELRDILESRLEDMKFLIEKNIDIIMEKAKEGRASYEENS